MLHRSRWVTALVIAGMSTAAAALTAQQSPPRLAKNTVFAEVTFLLLVGNVSVNYERQLNEWLSARVGVGAGYVWVVTSGYGGSGVLGMLHYSTPRSEHKFEAGLGASYVSTGPYDPGARVYPSVTLGYRHQPAQGGFVFRAGANWTYLYGAPFQASFGHAF